MSELLAARLAAVSHLLTAPAIEGRTRRHVAAGEVDWHALFSEARTMSAGERLLVGVAYDLWMGNAAVPLHDVATRLGAGSFERVVEALRISRGEQAVGTALLPAA